MILLYQVSQLSFSKLAMFEFQFQEETQKIYYSCPNMHCGNAIDIYPTVHTNCIVSIRPNQYFQEIYIKFPANISICHMVKLIKK